MSPHDVTRRAALGIVGAGSVIALAGCAASVKPVDAAATRLFKLFIVRVKLIVLILCFHLGFVFSFVLWKLEELQRSRQTRKV